MKRVRFATTGVHPLLEHVQKHLILEGYELVALTDSPDFCVVGALTLLNPAVRDLPVLCLSTGDVYSDRDYLLQQLDRTAMTETWGHVVTSPLDPSTTDQLIALLTENQLLTGRAGKTIVARIFDVYGPGVDGVVSRFLSAAKRGEPLAVHSPGYQERTFLHISDFLSCCSALVNRLVKGGRGIYNVGHSDPVSLLSLAKTIQQFYEENPPSIEMIEVERRGRWWKVPDIERVKADTKWKPKLSLRAGIWRMLNEGEK